jgi:hypothetical protein
MDVKIIGRSSGRSATGAAAYRAGEKLQSVAHSAYQSGEKLQGNLNSLAKKENLACREAVTTPECGVTKLTKGAASGVRNQKHKFAQPHAATDEKRSKITHDYRSKGGVVYKEIMLPANAPPELMDRETLWNAVELSEKRKDAQLAREIIVALPKEFNFQEQVDILRVFSQENFVKIGMIADLAIHDKGDENPHAHIMLTTRDVRRNGFGYKNTDWNKKELLLKWRKGWADVNNRMFERKWLSERIDHRSYKEQGIDRQPSIHMGRAATALEKKGTKTEKGDYNRQIQQRNAERGTNLERAAGGVTSGERNPKPEPVRPRADAADETRAALMDAQFRMRRQQQESKGYAGLELERNFLEVECDSYQREIAKSDFRMEDMDERVKNIITLQGRVTELQAERQNLHFWQIRRKREIDREIRRIEGKIRDAQQRFKEKYKIIFDEAPAEIERVKKEIRFKKSELEKKNVRIAEITKIFDDLEPTYHARRRRIACEIDEISVNKILAQMREPPKTQARDISKLAQIARNLDVDAITEDEFQKIIEGLHKIQINKTKLKRKNIPR